MDKEQIIHDLTMVCLENNLPPRLSGEETARIVFDDYRIKSDAFRKLFEEIRE